MDQDEVERRAPGILVGFVALFVGAMLSLLGLMYAPGDPGAPPGGLLGSQLGPTGNGDPGGAGDLPLDQGQSFGSPTLFVLMALGGVVLGGWATYLFRGARSMVLASTLVSLVAAYNLYGLLM